MQYALVIIEGEDGLAIRRDPARVGAYMGAWAAYSRALAEAGVLAGGAGLQLPESATTLRMVDGRRVVQDGPFADTKEQLGGFFLLDVADLDAALDWAARSPITSDGVIEVRPALQPPARG